MIASRSGPEVSSDVSFTARRYESVAAMTSLSPSNFTRMPVRTGRDSSREAARATFSIVASRAGAAIACSGTSSGGSRGKSSAL